MKHRLLIYSFFAVFFGLLIAFLSFFYSSFPLFLFLTFPFFLILAKTESTFEAGLVTALFWTATLSVLFEGLSHFYTDFFSIPILFGFVFHICICFLIQIPLTLFVSLSSYVRFKRNLNDLSFLLLFCLLLLIGRPYLEVVFPSSVFLQIGLYDSYYKQLVSILGPFGFETIFLIVNTFLAAAILKSLKQKYIFSILYLLLAIIFTGALSFIGKYEQGNWAGSSKYLKFAYYQPGAVSNLEGKDRFLEEARDISYLKKTISGLSEKEDIDFLLLPETFFESEINSGNENGGLILDLAKDLELSLISGGHSLSYDGYDIYNSVFHINSYGELENQYFKYNLMPIGEVKLLSSSFPKFSKIMPGYSVYKRGPSKMTSVKSILGLKMGFAICYEDVWVETYNNFSQLEADIVVSLSSDNMLKTKSFARVHAAAAATFALSFRKPFLRITNTGVSYLLSSNGRVEHLGSHNEKKTGVAQISKNKTNKESVYSKYSVIISLIFTFLIIISIFIIECVTPGRKSLKISS